MDFLGHILSREGWNPTLKSWKPEGTRKG
jgi:hypothetical protein